MAQRFIQQAKKRLNPLYQEQIQAQKKQIPAIQKLYQTLGQGLQAQGDQQIQTGVRNIGEDAIARGVARSTLPVDAQTELQSTIGQALAAGLGQLNLQKAQDIGALRGNIGDLRLQRTSAITSLADALQAADLREREFQMQKELARQAAARAGGGGGGLDINPPTYSPPMTGEDAANLLGGNISPAESPQEKAFDFVQNMKDSGASRIDIVSDYNAAKRWYEQTGDQKDYYKLIFYQKYFPDILGGAQIPQRQATF